MQARVLRPVGQAALAQVIELVRQAQASYEVSKATIRQREADLKFALAEINGEAVCFDLEEESPGP